MFAKCDPSGPLLTAIPALYLELPSSLSGNISLASCQRLQKLRLRNDYAQLPLDWPLKTPDFPAVFSPKASTSWGHSLSVLDIDKYDFQQTVTLPALTHLACTLPTGDSLQPSRLPALQVSAIRLPSTGLFFAHLTEYSYNCQKCNE